MQHVVSDTRLYIHLPLPGIFDGIGHQIVYYLPYAQGITLARVRFARAHKAQALGLGLRKSPPGTLGHKRPAVERHALGLQQATLQLVIVEDGGDKAIRCEADSLMSCR